MRGLDPFSFSSKSPPLRVPELRLAAIFWLDLERDLSDEVEGKNFESPDNLVLEGVSCKSAKVRVVFSPLALLLNLGDLSLSLSLAFFLSSPPFLGDFDLFSRADLALCFLGENMAIERKSFNSLINSVCRAPFFEN